MFSPEDLRQMAQLKISLEDVGQQLKAFEEGFPFTQLEAIASLGHGIEQLSETSCEALVEVYPTLTASKQICKFVPASGAATRMFKEVYEIRQALERGDKHPKEDAWLEALPQMAFYDDLLACSPSTSPLDLTRTLLDPSGLNYGQLPKGLLLFHRYSEGSRLAIEEHLIEAAAYASTDGVAHLHFTVSEEHLSLFQSCLNERIPRYEAQYGIRFAVSFSTQQHATDTLAVDLNNQPFRHNDGSLMFRPGGHGALIQNLNELDADLVFVKNIDNICVDRLRDDTIRYKKALGSLLIQKQSQIHQILGALDRSEGLAQAQSLADELGLYYAKDRMSDRSYWHEFFNRPIRVCGMVRNEGEPGGGPFYTRDLRGHVSLQIVESSQINPDSPQQQSIAQSATHFNPVDLVLGLKDYRGQRFNLSQYIDPDTGFISMKSSEGRQLKALERPGLWNGAMAYWITLFVEVPISVFSPVKTVMDLCRSQHRG